MYASYSNQEGWRGPPARDPRHAASRYIVDSEVRGELGELGGGDASRIQAPSRRGDGFPRTPKIGMPSGARHPAGMPKHYGKPSTQLEDLDDLGRLGRPRIEALSS